MVFAATAFLAILLARQDSHCEEAMPVPSEDEEIIRSPQRVLEGIELADLRGASEIVDEREWDFIGRLVPSVFTDFPTLCNLVYVDFAIYMAPMKCLVGVDTKIVGIRHLEFLLYVEVAILPDTEVSPNYFDDVGLLVAKATSDLYNNTRRNRKQAHVTTAPRSDDNFAWLSVLEGRPFYRLIGFVDVGLNLAKRYRKYTRLYMAENVTFNIEQCYRALHYDLDDHTPHERVPCVLLCGGMRGGAEGKTKGDGHGDKSKAVAGGGAICAHRFLYTLGSLLIDDLKTVIGISTWQDNTDIRYMTTKATHPPIGIAIPNKDYYQKNFRCAVKIRDHHWFSDDIETLNFIRDYALYDQLCTETKKFSRSRPIII